MGKCGRREVVRCEGRQPTQGAADLNWSELAALFRGDGERGSQVGVAWTYDSYAGESPVAVSSPPVGIMTKGRCR
jgi:hypothetical protein